MGQLPINPDYFMNQIARLESAGSCAELQEMTTEIMASLKGMTDGITAQMESIAPILALLQTPSNPITWIASFITHVLTPMYKPYISYTAQLAQVIISIAELTTTIQTLQARFPSCTINIPTVP